MQKAPASNQNIFNDVQLTFKEKFKTEPIVVRSPGRLNLIGEHTDYNEGFVLPAAINKAIYVAASAREDDTFSCIALDMQDTFEGNIHQLKKDQKHWPDYISGVIDQLQKAGHEIKGFNCVIAGDIPLGAGMSSSAALECSTIFALNELFQLGLDKITMIKLAQKAENRFVGVQSGIMDQFASMLGKKDHVIKLDCRSLEYEYLPFEMGGLHIVLFDTNVKHSLASSEYNTRRKQCEQGVALVKKHRGEVKSLRDVTVEMLNRFVKQADALIYKRCLYVVEEIQRLLDAAHDLEKGDLESFGKKMYATHEGLSKQYEVSCKELDFLVDFVKNEPAVLGARMMGGGFGGCTINLIKEDAIADLEKRISVAYNKAMKLDLKTYVAEIENGTELLKT